MMCELTLLLDEGGEALVGLASAGVIGPPRGGNWSDHLGCTFRVLARRVELDGEVLIVSRFSSFA